MPPSSSRITSGLTLLLYWCSLKSLVVDDLPQMFLPALVTTLSVLIRRFKKKKENKALTEAPTDKSTVFQASAFDNWHQDDRHHFVHHDNSGIILLTLMTKQAGLRTLHEAGPELQRTISTDLEVTSKKIFLLARQYFKDDVQQILQGDFQ